MLVVVKKEDELPVQPPEQDDNEALGMGIAT
jgi:hypothetical protein